MAGWYHWLNGHKSEQTQGDAEGQGSLACCSSWGCKELDMTLWLINNCFPLGFLHSLIAACSVLRTSKNPEKKKVFELLFFQEKKEKEKDRGPGTEAKERTGLGNLKLSARRWNSTVWGNRKQVWLYHSSSEFLTHDNHHSSLVCFFCWSIFNLLIFFTFKRYSNKTVLKNNLKANINKVPNQLTFC